MKKNPALSEIDRLRNEMDKMFKTFLDVPKMKWGELMRTPITPETHLSETKNEFVVKMGMPGLKKQDIDLKVSENMLEVDGHKKESVEVKKHGLFESNKSYKGFHTAFPMPAKVLPNQAQALYKKGVLEVHLPKAEPEQKIKKLRIN